MLVLRSPSPKSQILPPSYVGGGVIVARWIIEQKVWTSFQHTTRDYHQDRWIIQLLKGRGPNWQNTCNIYLLQKIFKEPVKFIRQLVYQLTSWNIYSVEDCKLFITERMVSFRTCFQNICICVLLYNIPDLS